MTYYVDKFPRPKHNTGFGLHDSSSTGSFPDNWEAHLADIKRMHVSWYKVLADGANKTEWVRFLAQNDIECIVRLYAPHPHPHFTPDYTIVKAYVDAGAHYFEIGNEPNIGSDEWSDWPGNRHIGEKIAGQWLRGSNEVKKGGGIPLFYAMTPGGTVNHRETWRQIIVSLRERKKLDSLEGCGVAVHVRPLNNPLDLSHENGNAYTADGIPVYVDSDGHFVRYANTTTHDEYNWFIAFFKKELGYAPPLFGTEAGYSIGDSQNKTHLPITRETHADWNFELYNRFNPEHPKAWNRLLFCECYWLDRDGGTWQNDEIRRTDFYKRLIESKDAWNRNAMYSNTETQPPTTAPSEDVPTADDIRQAGWRALRIPYNPKAAFQSYARKHGLGFPVTEEMDIGDMRAQGYANGILYAKQGQWSKIRLLRW